MNNTSDAPMANQPTNRIIDKIKKCLKLAESGNENEAAAALRQAQELMEKYKIDTEAIEPSSYRV